MQVVILAAGKGTRMGELTKDVPKPLLKIGQYNLIEQKIKSLPDQVDEVILVIGYLGDVIKEYFGDSHMGKKISYVWQPEKQGTGHALFAAQDLIAGKFLVMMGDDLYDSSDIVDCLTDEWSMLVAKRSGEYSGGLIIADIEGNLQEIKEGKHQGENLRICTGLFVLQPSIFEYPLVKLEGKEEWGMPQTIAQATDKGIKIREARNWWQINSPEELERAKEDFE